MYRRQNVSSTPRRHPFLYILLAFSLAFAQPATIYAAEDVAATDATTEQAATGDTPPPAETTTSDTAADTPPAENVSSPTSTEAAEASTADTPDNVALDQPEEQAAAATDSESQPDNSASSASSEAVTPGPASPTGADAGTYTLNPATGLWENDYYAWDPETKQTKPLETPAYSYNPETGMWDTTEWVFDAPSGTYVENKKSSPVAPTVEQLTALGLEPTEAEKIVAAAQATKNPAATSKETVTANQPTTDAEKKAAFDLFYNASISNSLTSLAESGDALVSGNTLAGDALSGDATAIANLINLLQSSWGMSAGELLTFLYSISGDVFGDMTFNPDALPTGSNANQATNVDVNASADAQIVNDIQLDANSGNATVSSNTQAGDATSGDAYALANIVNAINSAIASNTSFLGMINIFGNLNGDILLPENLLNALLASGGTQNVSQSGNLNVATTTNQTIANNIDASAASGNATVASNTQAGGATTGDATTSVTLLNLTGRQILGERALLVFVNVMGSWVGMIMNAPQGSTSAALGGGISQDTTNPTNASLTSTTNSAIVNNVDISAASGNAEVSSNTLADGATSGDATAIVNIANIIGSTLGFTDWFGVLFINVFGSWNGSFGVDTDAGEPTPMPVVGGRGQGKVATVPQVVGFQPSQAGSTASTGSSSSTPRTTGYVLSSTSSQAGNNEATLPTATLAASTLQLPDAAPEVTRSSDSVMTPSDDQGFQWPLWQIVGMIVGISLLGTERALHYRDRRRSVL